MILFVLIFFTLLPILHCVPCCAGCRAALSDVRCCAECCGAPSDVRSKLNATSGKLTQPLKSQNFNFDLDPTSFRTALGWQNVLGRPVASIYFYLFSKRFQKQMISHLKALLEGSLNQERKVGVVSSWVWPHPYN